MCARFSLRTSTETIAAMFVGLRFPRLAPRYNIAPTQDVTCVRQDPRGQNELVQLRWGLIPFWAKDIKIGARMINVRAETVAIKSAFRDAFKKRRCLVLADGFFEWKKNGTQRQPYYVTRRDDQPFCMAGLWERWLGRGQPIESFSIITTDANRVVQPIHDRMPVILDTEHYEFWLDRELTESRPLEQVLVPYTDNELRAVPVGKTVNKSANDTPDCIQPISLQPDLFGQ